LKGLSEYDPALVRSCHSRCSQPGAELSEAISALRRYADRVELDPRRLAELDRRIEAVLGRRTEVSLRLPKTCPVC
jgi:DNA repair protein RecN (Recombination protein N)